ncbi:S-layer homology domain-containing protein [Paenibacillus lemnae]|uniref:SLH domain-containing protein n=1 Tax=Paenibacillus lemnae TaxID=1330551 RepID=A0A848M8P5_PAELE|nr:S-layer homology domain-containing protein [Paenibacillus lemnae]NMO96560.1 hypothetical protein [Paenibacillus lemnae]
MTTDSEEQFPYQRYEIKLDPLVKASDSVEVKWQGKSLPERKVSLYAWKAEDSKWIMLDSRIAGEEDFELTSKVTAGQYAVNGSISIMVQDEIAVGGASGASRPVTEDPYDFSFAWMSDTQYYSQSYPHIYRKNVQWLADNKEDLKLKYVIHTGDLVDKSEQEYQWLEADRNMKVLEDAQIPYGVLAGNHDVGHQTGDYEAYKKYFGDWRFKNSPVFGGSYDDNRGHYDLISAGGNDFIIVYMGWGLQEQEIQWMNEVVAKYPERKAILSLHEYLLVSNNRAPIADEIFEKVVKPNKNVIAALSGHYHDAELNTEELDDNGDGIPDRKVYQMLADYQGAPEGGLGYIRLMQFDVANNKLHIKTYSPYLDDYNYYKPDQFPGKDEFSLDLDLQPRLKRVATDYIGVSVYTNEKIGQVEQVNSGNTASVNWSGLAGNQYYQWYVKAEDDFSGMTLSDIWGFTAFAVTPPVVDPPSGGGSPGSGNPGVPSRPAPPKPPAGKPETSYQPGKGITIPGPDASGVYRVSAAVLQQAANESAGSSKTISVQLQQGADLLKDSYTLELDYDALNEAINQNKLALRVETPVYTMTLPAGSIPSAKGPAGSQLILKLESVPSSQNSGLIPHMTQTGIAFSWNLSVKQSGQDEKDMTIVSTLMSPAVWTWKLTTKQMAAIDPDYAGVYQVVNGKLTYVGGDLKESSISFRSNLPGTYELLEWRPVFADMNGSWAKEVVQKLAAKHLIQGVELNRYAPAEHVTRADFAVLAMRVLGQDADKSAYNFNDVAPEAYYADEVGQAAALGLIQGFDGSFRPKESITREEAAVLLNRLIEKLEISEPALMESVSFKDQRDISPWAVDDVTKLQQMGILQGKGRKQFEPEAAVTRAELAKMMFEVLQLK